VLPRREDRRVDRQAGKGHGRQHDDLHDGAVTTGLTTAALRRMPIGVANLITGRIYRSAMLPTYFGVWRSLVACFVRDEEVVGSNPATPTM
jgi:hypothetical protein